VAATFLAGFYQEKEENSIFSSFFLLNLQNIKKKFLALQPDVK
jgi:hypothetical protein